MLNDTDVIRIAKLHSRTPAQVAMRWVLQHNALVVTAAMKREYIEDDLDIFDFELTESEMQLLDAK